MGRGRNKRERIPVGEDVVGSGRARRTDAHDDAVVAPVLSSLSAAMFVDSADLEPRLAAC
jgi:hypothetical protein